MPPKDPSKIKNVTGFPTRENTPRVNQQRMLPTAVPTRVLGKIISGAPESTALGSGNSSGVVTVSATSSRSVVFTTFDIYNRVILSVPDVAIYFGSISEANQWPNLTYNMGNFPVCIFNDWGRTNNVNSATRVQMYNTTASPIDVIVVMRARLIINPSGGQEDSNV